MLLEGLVASGIFIPDTIMCFKNRPIRLKFNGDSYQIIHDAHVVSTFYNDKRRSLIQQIGAVDKRDDNNLELRLFPKPLAVEKSIGNLDEDPNPYTRVLNSDSLKDRTAQKLENDVVIQEFIISRNRQSKINYYRIVYESHKVEQSKRRPMKVYYIVQRSNHIDDPDFKEMNDRIQKDRRNQPCHEDGNLLKSKTSKKPPRGANFKVQMESLNKDIRDISPQRMAETTPAQQIRKLSGKPKFRLDFQSGKNNASFVMQDIQEISARSQAKVPMDKQSLEGFKNKKFRSNLDDQYLIQLENDNKSNIFQQNINHIKDQNIEVMIEGLVHFLHQIFTNIKIKLIVVDFIVDMHGKVWLTDVKHIKTVKFLKIEEKQQL